MYPVHRLSQRLELREFQEGDADAVFAIYGSERATEHLSFEPRTLDQVQQIVARSIKAATTDPRTEYALAVTQRVSGELIGFGRLALDPPSRAEPPWVSLCGPRPGARVTGSKPCG
ncbi:hypothetical protein C1703_12045 [Streptomyces sp. Go-475]|nr:hypothetical protein C1703_12045 [Streptomyces sp. Go-475]